MPSRIAKCHRNVLNLRLDMPLSCSCDEGSLQQQSSQISSSIIPSAQRQQRRSSAAFTNLLSILEIRQTVPGYFAEHSVMASQRTVFLEPVLSILPEWGSEYSSKMVSLLLTFFSNGRNKYGLVFWSRFRVFGVL